MKDFSNYYPSQLDRAKRIEEQEYILEHLNDNKILINKNLNDDQIKKLIDTLKEIGLEIENCDTQDNTLVIKYK
jgi:phosphoglycerol transferase MdoB-like AlkP superfamily enzyme